MRTKTLSTCAAILILSGMPLGIALAQQPTDPRNPGRPGTQERQPQGQSQERTRTGMQRPRDFTNYDDLHGSRVHNNAGDAIASVRDLIVDRGTGEIKHVVIRSGSIMGMGGSHVAMPYEMFEWDAAEQRLTLNYTEDQIQNMREFDSSAWSNLLSEDAAINHQNAYQQLPQGRDQQMQQDNLHQSLRNSESVELTGTVRRISTDHSASGHPLKLTVETTEHGTVDVLLGPAWYAMGFSGAPMRGERVTIQAAEMNRKGQGITPNRPGTLPDQRDPQRPTPRPGDRDDDRDRDNRDRDNRDRDSRDRTAPGQDSRPGDTRSEQSGKTFVARSVRGTRGEVNLRNDDWQPLWDTDARQPGTPQGQPGSTPRQPGTTQRRPGGSHFVPFRYVLMSDVIGKDTHGRAEECGEVQTAIIDTSNGRVAFLGVDADENFLGIGNDTYLVPWSIVRVQASGVVIDSSCSQIKSSSPVPDDLESLRDESAWQRLFRNFDVDQPDWNDQDMRRPMDPTRDRDHGRDRDNRPMPRR